MGDLTYFGEYFENYHTAQYWHSVYAIRLFIAIKMRCDKPIEKFLRYRQMSVIVCAGALTQLMTFDLDYFDNYHTA